MELEFRLGVNNFTSSDKEVISTLPYDTLYEICKYLAPEDLLHLSWGNKALNWQFASIHSKLWWTISRKNVACPEPPPGISEPKWASVMCGEYCEICHKKISSTSEPQFSLLVNLCAQCFDDAKLSESELVTNFPDEYDNVKGILLSQDATDDKIYMLIDAHKCIDKYSQYSEEERKQFIRQRMKLRQTVTEHEQEYRHWRRDRLPKKVAELSDLFYYKQRLVNIIVKSRMHLLETAYQFYLDTLPPHKRAYQPSLFDVCSMEGIVQKICAPDFKLDITWFYESLPEKIQGLLNLKIQFLVVEMRKQYNASDIFPTVEDFEKELGSDNWNTDYAYFDYAGTHMTKLAISIYQCPTPEKCTGNANKQVVIGWDEALAHKCFFQDHSDGAKEELRNNDDGAFAAQHLVQLAGFNPKFQTPLGMDRCGMRVICLNCDLPENEDDEEEEDDGGDNNDQDNDQNESEDTAGSNQNNTETSVQRKVAYTWRSAIEHALTPNHRVEWRVLDDAEKERLEYEGEDPATSESCWTCNHCWDFEQNDDLWYSEEGVLVHLLMTHNVTEAKKFKDYFMYESYRKSQRPTAMLTVAETVSE